MATTLEAFGGIDILVLNGGGPPPGAAADVTAASVTAAVELLLVPHVRLVGLCLPHLRASGRGRIIAIESTSVKEPIANLALSNAVRPGVVGWLKTLARELGPDGITVNTIAPGRIDTERLRSLYGAGRPAARAPRADPGPARRRAGRDRRDRLLPRLGAGRLRQRRGRAGRRRHAERAPLAVTRQRATMLLWGAAAVAAVVLGLAWFVPANDYLYVPNAANPVADKVKVEGEKPGPAGEGGIYYVDVNVRRATWAEQLLPFLRPEGASLVPKQQVVPPGTSFEDRRADGLREMARSEQVAAAVALEAGGLRRDRDRHAAPSSRRSRPTRRRRPSSMPVT